ncbi:hypothetical protein OV079_35855 [Nannocystis pusilla]|uniref:Uncharacterized protein n=1 Tax=Nannocystis pusilla TaxID=889268 RepID=A0A9X3EV28_9BACT|nr:hypothetical protein [Nannocystis pusilla]MCY1010849.1 hypothetical protein [Nannocystis pusilla]
MSLSLACLLAFEAADPAPVREPECERADDRCQAGLYLRRATTAKQDRHRAMTLLVAHRAHLVGALAKDTSAKHDATPEVVRPTLSREEQRERLLLRIGVGTLVPGALLFIPMAALLGHRAAGERELAVLNLDTAGRPTSAAEDATAAALGQRYTSTTAGAIALGITGGVLAVTGIALLAMDTRRVAVAPWGARGLGGLVLTGRF